MITLLQFRKLFRACPPQKAAQYLPLLVAAMQEFGIVTRKRAASFFAQLGHESLDFKYMEEIASGAAYEGRKDLGNIRPGDGRRFKGRGPIQTTGRLNYTRAAIALNLPLTDKPELLSIPANGFRASAFFWKSEKLNVYADALSGVALDAQGNLIPKEMQRFDKITKRVNGGYNGRDDRQNRYAHALSILTDPQFEDARFQHTLDVLTVPPVSPQPATAPEGQAAQAAATSETSVQGQQTPAAASPAPSPETSLLDEIPVNEQTKAVGMTFLKRAGLRAGLSFGALWSMGFGVRLALIFAAAFIFGLAYRKRTALIEAARKVLRKLK